MAAPATASATTAEVQTLRGRCLQLEAELAAALKPTHTITFVGSCCGFTYSTAGIGSSEPTLGNAAPTAHMNATAELTKWKTANPNAVILSEDHVWNGLTGQWQLGTEKIPTILMSTADDTNAPPVKTYTKEEVRKHNKEHDCWVIIRGSVYALPSDFNHPGGSICYEAAGKDGSILFEDGPHGDESREVLKQFFIGKLSA